MLLPIIAIIAIFAILMSISYTKEKTKKPPHSVLSNPRKKGEYGLSHQMALIELSRINYEITAHDFFKLSNVNSADKRLNELFHYGYADSRKTQTTQGIRLMYKISEKGREKLLSS